MRSSLQILVLVVCLLAVRAANGIFAGTYIDPPAGTHLAVYAAGTATPIAPRWLLATKHQGPASVVTIGGASWTVDRTVPDLDSELVLVHVTTDLPAWFGLPWGPAYVGQDVSIGGCGETAVLKGGYVGPASERWAVQRIISVWPGYLAMEFDAGLGLACLRDSGGGVVAKGRCLAVVESVTSAGYADYGAIIFAAPVNAAWVRSVTGLGMTMDDLFAFLSAWFTRDQAADIDGNSRVDVADIFAFLREWFATQGSAAAAAGEQAPRSEDQQACGGGDGVGEEDGTVHRVARAKWPTHGGYTTAHDVDRIETWLQGQRLINIQEVNGCHVGKCNSCGVACDASKRVVVVDHRLERGCQVQSGEDLSRLVERERCMQPARRARPSVRSQAPEDKFGGGVKLDSVAVIARILGGGARPADHESIPTHSRRAVDVWIQACVSRADGALPNFLLRDKPSQGAGERDRPSGCGDRQGGTNGDIRLHGDSWETPGASIPALATAGQVKSDICDPTSSEQGI